VAGSRRQLRLKKQVEATLNAFEKAIAARPKVMECFDDGGSNYICFGWSCQISRSFRDPTLMSARFREFSPARRMSR